MKAMPSVSKTTKLIAALIIITMVFQSFLCFLFSWAGLIPMLASMGGAIVFLGLWIEKEADEEAKKEEHLPPELRKKAAVGWRLLMAGIVFEIVIGSGLAAFDVYENANANNRMAAADPRNLPINSISGYARIEIRPKDGREMEFAKKLLNFHDAFRNDEPQFSDLDSKKGETALLVLGKRPNKSLEEGFAEMVLIGHVVFVGTLSGEALGIRRNKPYVPNICFDLTFDSTKQDGFRNPNKVTFNDLSFVQIEGLGKDEATSPLQTMGGEIVLIVNKDWPKTFQIPPQTNQFWRVSTFLTNGGFIAAGYGLLTNAGPVQK